MVTCTAVSARRKSWPLSRRTSVNLQTDQIRLDGVLKELGLYTVKFRLSSEVEGELKVWVVPIVGADQ